MDKEKLEDIKEMKLRIKELKTAEKLYVSWCDKYTKQAIRCRHDIVQAEQWLYALEQETY